MLTTKKSSSTMNSSRCISMLQMKTILKGIIWIVKWKHSAGILSLQFFTLMSMEYVKHIVFNRDFGLSFFWFFEISVYGSTLRIIVSKIKIKYPYFSISFWF